MHHLPHLQSLLGSNPYETSHFLQVNPHAPACLLTMTEFTACSRVAESKRELTFSCRLPLCYNRNKPLCPTHSNHHHHTFAQVGQVHARLQDSAQPSLGVLEQPCAYLFLILPKYFLLLSSLSPQTGSQLLQVKNCALPLGSHNTEAWSQTSPLSESRMSSWH